METRFNDQVGRVESVFYDFITDRFAIIVQNSKCKRFLVKNVKFIPSVGDFVKIHILENSELVAYGY